MREGARSYAKDSARYKVANCIQAQPVFSGFARLAHGKVIFVSVLTFWQVTDVAKNGKETAADFTSMPTFSAGGGLAIYLSESWALDVNVKAAKGTFRDVPVGHIAAGGTSRHSGALLQLDAASVRLGVGVSWWP